MKIKTINFCSIIMEKTIHENQRALNVVPKGSQIFVEEQLQIVMELSKANNADKNYY